MKVTSNLRDALRMLANSITLPQMPKTPSYYWIDALCVDQSNILERNAQVARMAQIFRKAQSVVVWLGKEDEFTSDAVTTIERVSAIPEDHWDLVPYTSFYGRDQDSSGYCPNLTHYNWLGFITLINRPWFKRAWVVQEIALAKSALVVCGSKVFSWNKLSQTLFFIKRTKWYHHLHTEKLKHVTALKKDPGIYKRVLRSRLDVGIGPVYLNATRERVYRSQRLPPHEGGQKPPLGMLLGTHRFAKSTDPRDKVYAFLGLANRNMAPFRTQPKVLTPNYNLSVQQVYTEAARALLSSYRNLWLLSHVEDPSLRKIEGLPSWVPDYSVSLDPYPLRFRGSGVWRAARKLPWDLNVFTMAKGELDVQGYHVDSVDQASVMMDESNDPSAMWASIVKLALSLELPYPNPTRKTQNPTRVEVLWRTLTTDTYNKVYPAPPATGSLFIDYILNLQIRHRLTPWSSADEFQPHHSPLSESIYPEWRTLLQLEPPDSLFGLRKYQERLPTVIESLFNGTYSPIELAQLQHEFDISGGKRRRIFKTRDGYLGTGPRSLKSGDEVWVLHGGGTPFVLRPQSNGNYRLIGEVFVYGIMHGEAVDMELPRRQIVIE